MGRSLLRRAFSENPARLLAAGFFVAALAGAVALALPMCNADGAWHFDTGRLFVAVSAVCVTGLDPIGVGAALSPAGLAALALLAQLGGLGIMTAGTFLFVALGRSLSVTEERSVSSSLGEIRPRDVRRVLVGTFAFTFLWEAAGALFLAARLHSAHHGYASFVRSAGHGAFLSVMSFCNAGFSPLPDSFASFAWDPAMTLGSAFLALVGGVGFVVHANLLSLRPWRRVRSARGRLSLNSRLVLEGLALFGAVDVVAFFLLERHGAFAGLGGFSAFCASVFHAVSARASGFAIAPAETFSPAVQFLTGLRAFVGAAPGSTGGGVKTTTMFVLAAAVAAMFARREVPELHERSLPRRMVNDALAIFSFGLCAVFATALALLCFERPEPDRVFPLVFESVSAYANNGLSMDGTTASLGEPSRLVLCAVMLAGRIGPATLVLTLFRPHLADRSKRYPEENVVVG